MSPFSEVRASISLPDKRDFPKVLKTIGDHLRQARLLRKMLIKDVATILGVGPGSLHEWEHNKWEPYARKYPQILAFLGYYPFEVETLGGRIRKYRYVHGLTHQEFGKLVGAAGCTISTWERNKIAPRYEGMLQKISTLVKTVV